jgi:hypothetical protein
MACAADNPPPADRSETGQGGRLGGEERGRQSERQEYEAYGPLDIARSVKDDDRVLLVYARRKRMDA